MAFQASWTSPRLVTWFSDIRVEIEGFIHWIHNRIFWIVDSNLEKSWRVKAEIKWARKIYRNYIEPKFKKKLKWFIVSMSKSNKVIAIKLAGQLECLAGLSDLWSNLLSSNNATCFLVVGRLLGNSSIRSLGPPIWVLKSKNRALGNYELMTF